MVQQPGSPDERDKAREITHDLHNLLGVVITYSELARQSLPDGHPADADMAEIGEAAREAVALVNKLASLSAPHD